jgi:hypothetical protein
MPLAPVLLDDLNWTDMVESIRRRIAGASDGVWTHHGPVDPGVTLLELFASLIEQRAFWIDQVPEELTRALLAVAGERPLEALPATTVLSCAAPQAAPFLALPPRVVFTFASVDEPRAFTSTTGAVLAPITSVSIETEDGDRTADLRARPPVPLMRSDGAPAEIIITLWLKHTGPLPAASEKLSLLFELDTSENVPPAWTAEAAEDVPPPARIVWSYSVGGVEWRDFDPAQVEDGTGGFRRSGIVRVPLRTDWAPRGVATPDVTPFALRARTARSTFTFRPRLSALAWNVVRAEHWIEVAADGQALAAQARQWLKLPGQSLELPADQPPPIGESVRVRLRERDAVHEWLPAADFAFGDRAHRVFVVDRERRTVHFGDGVSARIPVPADPAAPEVAVTYRAGAGTAGLMSPDRPWHAVHTHATVEARNSVAATGGCERETIEAAGRRIAGLLSRNRRAVTADDYVELATTTPGVAIARAFAAIGRHPLHPCAQIPGVVTVFVVPFAPRDPDRWHWPDASRVAAPVVDPGALDAVRAQLNRTRLIGTQVFVRSVEYRPVAVHVIVSALPAPSADFDRRIGARLSRFLDPLAGGDDGDGLPFGEPVRPSALLRIAQQALQRDALVEQVLIGLDGAAASEACNDLAIGPYDLTFLHRLDVSYRSSPSLGGLP